MNEGKRIRERRKELGLSQEELAKMVGYAHKASISKIENGDRDFPIDQIVPIAKALDVSPSYIMGWEERPADNALSKRLMAYAQRMNVMQFAKWIDDAETILNEETPG